MSEVEKVINGEVHTRDSIVEKHKGLVHKECHKLRSFAKRVGQDYDDIVSVGFIGLIDAFDKFDGEEHDVRFSTYAVPLIWGGIQNFLRRCGTGVHYPANIKQLGWNIRKNELEDFSINEIAMKMETDRKKVIHALDFLQYGTPGSLDQPILQAEGESTIADLIGEPDDTTGMFVQEFLDTLTERERIVVVGLMDGKTQSEIGSELGVSRSYAWIIKETIAKKYLEFSSPQESEQKPMELKVQEGEGEEVAKKENIEITEASVNKMKADGMTYAAIAKEFGISAPRLATLRQNWELERVRAQHKEGQEQSVDKPRKTKGASTVKKAEKDMLSKHPLPTSGMVDHENEIRVLKESLIRKMDIIQEQKITIDQLKAERDELAEKSADRNEATSDWQEEIKDERKLLAILLERETARIKKLMEVG